MTSDSLINNQNGAHPADADHHDIGSTKIFGFWIYLMSDCILFATLFATYAVLVNGTAGGPSGKEIFDLRFVLLETFLLLFSSLTYGLALLEMNKGNSRHVIIWLICTFFFGLSFIAMELFEFYELVMQGYGPQRSAFLSAFFALLATHGFHVLIGLAWIMIMICQIARCDLNEINKTRLMCLSLFWHFLDVIWICVFTVVYLLGAM